MNDEVKDKIVEYLEVLENAVKQTSDFAQDQLPALAQEVVTWHLYGNIFIGGLLSIVVIGLSVVGYLFGRAYFKTHDDGTLGVLVGTILATAGLALLAAFHWYCAVKAIVAPRLVILEKISELIN